MDTLQNNNKILNITKIIILGLIIGFGANYIFATWTPAPANQSTNADTPLNVGSTGQTKAGGLVLNTNGAVAGLVVQAGKIMVNSTAGAYGQLQLIRPNSGEVTMLMGANVTGWGESTNGVVTGSNPATLWIFGPGSYTGDPTNFNIGSLNNGIPSFTVKSSGNVGVGTTGPTQKLDVAGQIHASGDICTDVNGGKCLSTAGGSSSTAGRIIGGAFMSLYQNGTFGGTAYQFSNVWGNMSYDSHNGSYNAVTCGSGSTMRPSASDVATYTTIGSGSPIFCISN
ncbi:MAG: hypothetical protein NTZ87_04155 [Candidatus Nomurabacteria bacterium]|nr:hypothetical protein [Candidatus Nomurabacteria bacterium]